MLDSNIPKWRLNENRRMAKKIPNTSIYAMKTNQSLSSSLLARKQAQFLPTQRSAGGRAPADSRPKRGSPAPACRAKAAVVSLESSSTTSSPQCSHGASLARIARTQSLMLSASL